MQRLKIGLFIDTFFPMIDGVIMVVDNYAKRLNKIADVTVFCPKPNDKNYKGDFSYKEVRCKKLKVYHYDYSLPLPKLDKKFKKALKEANLDIVHVHSPATIGMFGIKYAKKHNIPCVVTLHSQFKKDILKMTHIKWLTNLVTKRIMNRFNTCDEAWAVNAEIKNLFESSEYNLKIPCRVVENATDLQFLPNVEQNREEIKNKFGISQDEHIFLFTGRINVMKNILFIVDALKIVKDKGIKFKMLFVGSGQDENKLKAYVEQNGLTNNVVMVGRVEDRSLLAKIYSASELFLFPSLYDANSLVQIEAASQKTPAIFLEGARTAGNVTNNVNGIISKNDASSYAEEIVSILSDKQRYEMLCENAYRDLYINWDMVTKEVYEMYQKLIEKNNLPKQ